MSRYIDADEARKNVFSILHGEYPTPEEDAAVGAIDDTPTADVAPVVHAQWETREGIIRYCCSICGGYAEVMFRYCHWCGAKMDAKENEK